MGEPNLAASLHCLNFVVAKNVTIVGAGMSGPLMAIYLARRGFEVEVYERRPARGRDDLEAGKSIKLTLAERGLHALAEVGLAERVKADCCIPLRGRAVHSGTGSVAFIPYGKNEREVIYSFSRCDLNALLVDAAAAYSNIRFCFSHRCVGIDKEAAAAIFLDDRTGATQRVEADLLIGADGAFSRVRQEMHRGESADYRQDFLPWGYKELSIVAGAGARHQMEKHALHIWPCGSHMLFGLPSLDGSFNAVCTLPFHGENSFESVRDESQVRSLFDTYFGDAMPLMPDLCGEFLSRPTSDFVTIRTAPWHHRGKVLLIGDACHAVVPFYGQGMNAAFEDCWVLDRCIAAHPRDLAAACAEFQASRKVHTDVLAELSIHNFHELCDSIRRPPVVARKRVMIALNRLVAGAMVPIYTLVSHSNVPYAECVQRVRKQERIARLLGLEVLVAAVSVWIYLHDRGTRWRAAWHARRRRPVDPRRQPLRQGD